MSTGVVRRNNTRLAFFSYGQAACFHVINSVTCLASCQNFSKLMCPLSSLKIINIVRFGSEYNSVTKQNCTADKHYNIFYGKMSKLIMNTYLVNRYLVNVCVDIIFILYIYWRILQKCLSFIIIGDFNEMYIKEISIKNIQILFEINTCLPGTQTFVVCIVGIN